ncbi:ArdC family protein [Moorellaceae bacterium AZ2]
MKPIKTSKAVKNAKVQQLCNRLVEGVTKTLNHGEIAEFLRFMARFHKYSPYNVALIFAQYPKATLVAGLKTWNSMGRRVKKGEKGIAILAPTIKKVMITLEEPDPDTGDIRVVEKEEEKVVGFHTAYVFDVSQTVGKPLPERPLPRPVAGGETADSLLENLLEVSPFPVEWDCLDPGVNGEFNPFTGRIRLSTALEGGMKAKTLLHEIAHGLAWSCGLDGRDYYLALGKEDAYARGEAIAEGAAFVAASYFGLDTAGYSFNYIATWVKDAEKFLEWAEDVQVVARKLIELIEGTQPTAQLPVGFGQ